MKPLELSIPFSDHLSNCKALLAGGHRGCADTTAAEPWKGRSEHQSCADSAAAAAAGVTEGKGSAAGEMQQRGSAELRGSPGATWKSVKTAAVAEAAEPEMPAERKAAAGPGSSAAAAAAGLTGPVAAGVKPQQGRQSPPAP